MIYFFCPCIHIWDIYISALNKFSILEVESCILKSLNFVHGFEEKIVNSDCILDFQLETGNCMIGSELFLI